MIGHIKMQEQLDLINECIKKATTLEAGEQFENFLFVSLCEAKAQLLDFCKGLNINIVDKEI
jgi:hypothetical protein